MSIFDNYLLTSCCPRVRLRKKKKDVSSFGIEGLSVFTVDANMSVLSTSFETYRYILDDSPDVFIIYLITFH